MLLYRVSRLAPVLSLIIAVLSLNSPATAQDSTKLEAAAQASLGGPGSASAQQETDRLRRLEDSRWPGLDRTIDPAETAQIPHAKK